MMPIGDPLDRSFYPTLTLMMDSYRQAAHQILVLNMQVQIPLTNALADTFSKTIGDGLNFGLSLHLHPYFLYASSKGYGKSVHMCR